MSKLISFDKTVFGHRYNDFTINVRNIQKCVRKPRRPYEKNTETIMISLLIFNVHDRGKKNSSKIWYGRIFSLFFPLSVRCAECVFAFVFHGLVKGRDGTNNNGHVKYSAWYMPRVLSGSRVHNNKELLHSRCLRQRVAIIKIRRLRSCRGFFFYAGTIRERRKEKKNPPNCYYDDNYTRLKQTKKNIRR